MSWAEPQEEAGEAAFFRLEELIITSASKYAQKISEAPSAVAVITEQDIRQSGTLDLTQTFRFQPGVMVTETTSTGREVFLRGFPQQFSPRSLVLLDGVPLYTPLFGGVTWPLMPIALPNTERVEIIRGASSTLYGANAFSGVINIISKDIDKTQSIYAYGSAGNLQLTEEGFAWNRPLTDWARFRLTGMFRHDRGYGANNGGSQFDAQLAVGQGTFEFEADLGENTKAKIYSNIKTGKRDAPFSGLLGNQNLQYLSTVSGLRLSHDLTDQQNLTFIAAYQGLNEDGFAGAGALTAIQTDNDQRQASAELIYTHHFGERDTLLAGASMRHGSYRFLDFMPVGRHRMTLASFFVNNDFKILDNLILTTGGRFEYDSFTENQLVGRANITYAPWKDHTFRMSAARAVRTPSVAEDRVSVTIPSTALTTAIQAGGLPGITGLLSGSGNGALKAATVIAGEAGYTGRFLENRLTTNIQFYFNHLKNSITLDGPTAIGTLATTCLTELATTGTIASGCVFDPVAGTFTVPITFRNRSAGQVYGIETDFGLQVTDWWRTSINYTLTRQRNFQTGAFPKNLFNFKNRFAFNFGFSAELLFNWTDNYTFFDTLTASATPIAQIFRLDARVAQKFYKDRFEIAVVGQNLIDAPHNEVTPALRVDRLIYGMLTFTY